MLPPILLEFAVVQGAAPKGGGGVATTTVGTSLTSPGLISFQPLRPARNPLTPFSVGVFENGENFNSLFGMGENDLGSMGFSLDWSKELAASGGEGRGRRGDEVLLLGHFAPPRFFIALFGVLTGRHVATFGETLSSVLSRLAFLGRLYDA